jgi:hypothetical protein
MLLGTKVGNGLSCFVQGCQQGVHAVLRLDANFLVGQVDVKLNSCRKRKWGVRQEAETLPYTARKTSGS